jgi:hypothetical protein
MNLEKRILALETSRPFSAQSAPKLLIAFVSLDGDRHLGKESPRRFQLQARELVPLDEGLKTSMGHVSIVDLTSI